MRRPTALAVAAGAALIAAIALGVLALWPRGSEPDRLGAIGSTDAGRDRPGARASSATPGASEATPPTSIAGDASDPFARLLYLHYNERRQLAVLNHDSETPRRTYFVKIGESLLDASVKDVTADRVVLVHPERGEIVIPYLGIAEAAAPIERPYDARRDQLPVVYSDNYDFAEEARVNAEIARRMATAGRGGGKGDGSGGGKGRRGKRGKRNHDRSPGHSER